MVVIAVDAMGGDLAPRAAVAGAVAALEDSGINKILLTGQADKIAPILEGLNFDTAKIQIIDAPDIIDNDDSPTAAIREKKDSSLVVGLNLVRDGQAGAFVSAGSTGAVLTGATLLIGRIKGILRPALATIFPTTNGLCLIIDCGANVDSKPQYLAQFAQMGSVYMREIYNISNPKVGLINIGTEAGKGDALAKDAYGLLGSAGVNFAGNIEAREIPFGAVDVAVCDGFVGNVLLKYGEGFAKGLMGMLKDELMKSPVSKVGALLSRRAYTNLRKKFDYREVGGAPFIGLNGLVVKAHGSSDEIAIKNAIKQCAGFIRADIVKKIQEKI